MLIEVKNFGMLSDGGEALLYKIGNSTGAYITVTNYGATVVSVCVPDKNGRLTDVCLGYETLREYVGDGGYLGKLVGRCANRIAGGRFRLNGKEYSLPVNNAPNHLHGGVNNFSAKLFDCEYSGNTLRFTLFSADGEEGYPGNLRLVAEYSFTENNEIVLNYKAVCDADTVVNITNHSYFDLNGQGSGKAMEQKIRLYADAVVEANDNMIPTGKLRALAKGDPFDFSEFKRLSDDIQADDEQLKIGGGYDHCFVLSGNFTSQYGIYNLKHAADAVGEDTGIKMEIFTTKPGMQIYTANFLGDKKGKDGARYADRSGVAFETQYYPDAVNHSEFPSPVLKPLDIYSHTTIYRFTTV